MESVRNEMFLLLSGMGIYKALKSKGHQVMLLDVFLGYANEDWKNVFEKDVDWTASVGAIKGSEIRILMQ